MFLVLYLQGSLLLGGAHIVKEEWKYVREVRGLCSDPLSQVKVLRNRQDKQDNPTKDRSRPTNKINVTKNLLMLANSPGLQEHFDGFLIHKLEHIPCSHQLG